MTFHVEVTKTAERDVHVILSWLLERSPIGAIAWYPAWELSRPLNNDAESNPLYVLSLIKIRGCNKYDAYFVIGFLRRRKASNRGLCTKKLL